MTGKADNIHAVAGKERILLVAQYQHCVVSILKIKVLAWTMQDHRARDLHATVRVIAGAELQEAADGPAGD
jgi:hypothetical protein